VSGVAIPVVAAGGIIDGRGIVAAFSLGAAGVLTGTRFYAAEESLAASEANLRVVRSGGDVVPARVIVERLLAEADEAIGRLGRAQFVGA
jgi:nitronate monooxygenase